MAKRTSPKTEEKPFKYLGSEVRVTYHPSAVLMGGFHFEEAIIADLRRFGKKHLGRPRKKAPVPRAACVGFDTEYDPSGRLLTVGIADSSRAIAYEGDFKPAIRIIKKAKEIVGHSITGDLDHLVRLGAAKEKWLKGIGVRDSLLLARMYDENRGKGGYGLEALLLAEFNAEAWKQETEMLLKKTGNAADWTQEQREERCRLDAWATKVLAEHFERKLQG